MSSLSNPPLNLQKPGVYDQDLILSVDYNVVVQKLRHFFLQKGFIEVPTQSRLSILAACEDPRTIQTYTYENQLWPLPQTGQMWLEYELLTKPKVPGFFCVSTSYRQEPNPIPGRHKTIFPMFEFETHGNFQYLCQLEKELIAYLGIASIADIQEVDYRNVAEKYGVKELEIEHETAMEEDYGRASLLEHFPIETSPFWNMRMNGDTALKVDAIIAGQETIGSAERAVDTKEMREMFLTISDGGYAGLIFDTFGKERVMKELEDFLSFDFFERCGGGIGVTRLMSAMKKYGLLESQTEASA